MKRLKKSFFFFTLFSVLLISFSLHGQNYFYHLLGMNRLPNFTWVGLGGDANWNTALNWSNNAVPGVGDTAHFMGAAACAANCSPTINVAASVAGIDIQASYAGTITQAVGQSLTIGSAGWTQAAGTFAGGDSNITINGTFIFSGGTFTSTSAQMMVTSGFNFTAGTFNHNNGLLRFDPNGIAAPNSIVNVTLPGAVTLYQLQYSGGWGGSSAGYTVNITSGSFDVQNKFTIGLTVGAAIGTIMATGGTINLRGSLEAVGATSGITAVDLLTTATTLVMNGPSAQTYESLNGGRVPHLVINNVNGVTPTIGTTSLCAQSFNLQAGSFTAPPNTFNVLGAFTYPAATTYINNGGSLNFTTYSAQSTQSSTISLATAISTTNVSFGGGVSGSSFTMTWNLAGATPNIIASGNLTIGNTSSGIGAIIVNGGTVNVAGNYLANSYSGTGTTAITIDGAAAQSYSKTGPGANQSGTITVNKAGGTFSLASSASFNATGQNLTVSAGIMSLAGLTLTVGNVVTVASGAKLICAGGTLSAASYVINGEVSCGSSVGITWTGLGLDNNWNTAGNWTNNTIPGAGDIAIFNGNCAGVNCNANMNVAVNVRGISILSSYTGTLTQQAGNALTIGAAGFSQAGGTFVGGNSAVSSTGPFSLSAGAFTSTSSIWTQSGNWSVTGAPTFTHNSGTINFSSGITIVPSTVDYFGIGFTGSGATYNLSAGTMNVLGTLSISHGAFCCGSSQISNGTLSAKGDINAVSSSGGSAWVRITGSGNQTVTGALAGTLANLQINSTGGTVSFVGTIAVNGNFTYTAGTVDWGTSVLRFRGSTTIIPGNLNYKDVYFGDFTGGNYNLSAGTMKVLGTLSIDNGVGCCGSSVINNGTIEASSDVNLISSQVFGTALLKIVGSTNQTITGVTTAPTPAFEIASTGGTVSFVGTIRIGGPTFKYTSGVVDFGISTLQFFTSITITPGALLYGNVSLGTAVNAPAINLNTGTMIINGTLNTDMGTACCGSSQITNGTIEAKGNVNLGGGSGGSALIKISGTGNQTVTGVNTGYNSNLEIVSTGGTVTLAGVINLNGTFTYTSGVVAPGASTVQFVGTQTLVPNGITLNNVNFTGTSLVQSLSGQILNVNGALAIVESGTIGSINNGTINANGNVDFVGVGRNGTAVLNFTGASTTTLSSSVGSTMLSTVNNVAKTGVAAVNLITDVAYSAAGRSFNVASGVLNMNANDLDVNNVLTVSVGATLKCSGGTLTYGSLVNSGTINCPGFAAYDFNWTGAGGNNNWNTAGNWQIGSVPTSSDVAYFDPNYCGATCDATFNVDPNVRGIWTFSTYAGTITQPSSVTATIGRFGWRHQNGTFVGGNSNMLITGGLTVNAGSFTMTSATTTLGEQRCGTKTILNFTGGSLAHNNGRLKIAHQRPFAASCSSVANLGFPNGFNVYDFEIVGPSEFGTGWYSTAPATNGTLLNVLNNFYQYGLAYDFNIDLAGNLFVNHNTTISTTRQIRFMGTGTQEYTFTPGSKVANKIKIEKASGVVQSAVGNTDLGVYSFDLTQGSFTAPSGIFTVGAGVYATANITIFNVANGQTFTHNNGLTAFAYSRAYGASANSTGTITVPAGFNFYDVEVSGEQSTGGWNSYIGSGGSTLNVLRNFSHNGTIMNANWSVQGNVTIGANAEGGTGTMTMNGTGAQSLTAYPGSTPAGGTWTINKPSGTVTMYGSGLGLQTASQDLNLVAGTVDLNEAVLNVKDQFTISSGATVICNNGFYTAGTLSNSGTISCAGTSYVKTVLADNPKAYYRFGEPSGSYKIGSSAAGNSYAGTAVNSADITFGVNRVSASYTDKSVTTSNNGVFDIAGSIPLAASYTLETWFKTAQPNNGSGWNTLFRNGGVAGSGNHQIITQISNTNIGLFDNLGGTSFRTSGFAISGLSVGWHHLIVTGSGTTTNFYVDKVNVGSVPVKSTQAISQIGNMLSGGQAFGSIDEVAIYDSVLSQGQIDAHHAAGAPATTNIAWIEDSLPAGAITSTSSDSWNWVGSNPTPNTGTLAHKSDLIAGMHQHYFDSAVAFPIGFGDVFYIDVYINPTNPPTELMIQINDGTGWEHRVFWGADSLLWGTLGTNSRRYKGVIPATGQWVRLTFTAAEVGMVGSNMRGAAFSLNDGQVTWDQFGVIR